MKEGRGKDGQLEREKTFDETHKHTHVYTYTCIV